MNSRTFQRARRDLLLGLIAAHPVIEEVLIERRRQIKVEGFDTAHDDAHTDGSIADAAASFATTRMKLIARLWPKSWNFTWFRFESRRHALIKAATLLVAEIERLDRAAAAKYRTELDLGNKVGRCQMK
mgnify:CR=1 FL=1